MTDVFILKQPSYTLVLLKAITCQEPEEATISPEVQDISTEEMLRGSMESSHVVAAPHLSCNSLFFPPRAGGKMFLLHWGIKPNQCLNVRHSSSRQTKQ